VTAYGEPLEAAEVEPPALRPGCARLEILTCGVCFSDVKTARGRMPYSDALPLPHVCGHEICARVAETDPACALEPGTVVVVYHVWPCGRCGSCRAGAEQLCRSPEAWTGFTHPGGFQEQLVVPLDRLTVVPEGIDPVHAAPLTCALGTAYRAAITRGGVVAGSRVGVIGLGGVGIHALQIAVATGADAAGADVSPRALAVARELGLRAGDLDGDLDVVIDTVGSPDTIARAERLVRPGGRIVAVGYGVDRTFELPSARFVLEEIEVVGSRYVARDELDRAIRMVADGLVQTVVDRVLPLAAVNDAIAALEAGEVVGRVVLDVAGGTNFGH